MFPREGFNLDAQCEIPETTPAAAAVTLKHAKTIRIIGINVTADVTVTLGGQSVSLLVADKDVNGVCIAHIRGALCDANNNVQYALGGTGTVGGVFYELVDGPRR